MLGTLLLLGPLKEALVETYRLPGDAQREGPMGFGSIQRAQWAQWTQSTGLKGRSPLPPASSLFTFIPSPHPLPQCRLSISYQPFEITEWWVRLQR